MKILFLQAGGTIDKEYEKGAEAYNFVITTPAAERVLGQALPTFDFRIETVARKDSMDLTDEDRQAMVKVCEKAPESKIVITHGTDTMATTAQFLDHIKDKTIVLTGALVPERFYNSDASFNIGTAVGAVQALDHGVFIAMSGRIFPWRDYQKHPETGQFVERSKHLA